MFAHERRKNRTQRTIKKVKSKLFPELQPKISLAPSALALSVHKFIFVRSNLIPLLSWARCGITRTDSTDYMDRVWDFPQFRKFSDIALHPLLEQTVNK